MASKLHCIDVVLSSLPVWQRHGAWGLQRLKETRVARYPVCIKTHNHVMSLWKELSTKATMHLIWQPSVACQRLCK